MASFKIGFNEGTLFRRTIVHVTTFVLGTVTFIGLTSLGLVSMARGVVAPHAAAATTTDDTPAIAASAGTRVRTPRTPGVRPTRGQRPAPGAPPAGSAAAPAKDD